MSGRVRFPLCLALLAPLTAAPGTARAAWSHDPGTNLSLSTSTNLQESSTAVSDGAGGIITFWTEQVGAQLDIHAQRASASGTIAPGWPAAGLVVCSAAGNKRGPKAVSDGSGGAIVVWQDSRTGIDDIFAQHIKGDGTIAPGWPANGLDLSNVAEADDEFQQCITTDGAGGALVAWTLDFGLGDWDIYGAHVTGAGVIAWSKPLYAPIDIQQAPAIVSDGTGGMIVGFESHFTGDYDPQAMRVTSAGGIAWGPVSLITEAGDQTGIRVTGDGAGGAYFAWNDVASSPILVTIAHRTFTGGTPGGGWFSGFRAVTGGATAQQNAPLLAADGTGGCFFAWTDARYGGSATFMQHVTPDGFNAPGWPDAGIEASESESADLVPDGSGGTLLAGLGATQGFGMRMTSAGAPELGWPFAGVVFATSGAANETPTIVPDGSGGGVVSFEMIRSLASPHVYAQSIDGFGALGDARPELAKIADVPNDQGGHVSLQWTASYLDALPARTVYQYTIWRRVPGGTTAFGAARARAARAGRPLRAVPGPDGTNVVFWEYLETLPARAFAGYSAVVPTTSDSLPSGNPRTSFMVEAEEVGGAPFWSSAPDSGYSVDNIPPSPPAPFTGAYSAGATHLHWGANSEADLAGYRLYRGTSAGFVPSPANRIADQPDTGFVDAGVAGSYYKVSAVDIHGNESAFALLAPSGTIDVPSSAPHVLAFAAPTPDPAPGAARLAFELPVRASASLTVFDAAGRRVRTLVSGALDAGVHTFIWRGDDDSGRTLGDGLYFATLETHGHRITRRIALLR